MPNARTIRKRLMRNRQSVCWGERAFCTVRLPLSIYPPMPTGPDLARPEDGWMRSKYEDCMWEREITLDDESKEIEILSFYMMSCSHDPRIREDEILERHVQQRSHGWFSWWRGVRRTASCSRSEAVPPEQVDKFIALRAYQRTWFVGLQDLDNEAVGSLSGVEIEVIRAFLAANFWAQAHYTQVVGPYVYITYAVKWSSYPHRVRRFSAELRQAFEVARKHGVKAKLCKGHPREHS